MIIGSKIWKRNLYIWWKKENRHDKYKIIYIIITNCNVLIVYIVLQDIDISLYMKRYYDKHLIAHHVYSAVFLRIILFLGNQSFIIITLMNGKR